MPGGGVGPREAVARTPPPLFLSPSHLLRGSMGGARRRAAPWILVTSTRMTARGSEVGASHPSHALWFPLLLPQQRSEEHTSELQSLMRISYAVFCLKKKKKNKTKHSTT